MSFKLPDLPYAYNALEPHFDAKTMEIHHTKHHKAYTDNLNAAILGTPEDNMPIHSILANISKYAMPIRNNAGGFFNHNLFWETLTPSGGSKPNQNLMNAINEAFGSFEDFQKQFADAATKRFGSGWAWLIVNTDGKLQITSTPNQDNPLMDIAEVKGTPVLGLDVWEHAYYLHYQNRRADYITAFWNVVNWEAVSAKFESSK
jgi:Fe-Mn family superoxide dismutase